MVDVLRGRFDYPTLKRRVVEMAQHRGAHAVLIEDTASGSALIQDLRAERCSLKPIAIQPESDKLTRMSTASTLIEAGIYTCPKRLPG